jgi:RepB DNA-primase from phage plasmid
VSAPLPPRQGLVAFMATLTGPQPGQGWLELRHRRNDGAGMRQRFFPASEPQAAACGATVLARTGDVYVCYAPRAERAGHKHAVLHAWVLWVDCDDPASSDRLERFEPQPAIVVRTSQRGRHAYWPLTRPLALDELERANRRLAHALGADPACADAARILRPPATLSWKYEPPFAVALERYTGERLDPDQVTSALPDPPQTRARRPRGDRSAARAGDPLLAIEPAVYVRVLTGREVGRDGKVACPFHPDRTPSLHAYPGPAGGWACFSARCSRDGRPNGGDIYELAAQIWGLSTRGAEFRELRRRLYHLFLPGQRPPAPLRRRASTVA